MKSHSSGKHQKTCVAGLSLYGAGYGAYGCGTSGKGRFPSPERIVDFVKGILNKSNDYEGLKVLVTAGPTREPIDL